MTIPARLSKMFGALLIAFALCAASLVASPGVAAASAGSSHGSSHGLTATQAAPDTAPAADKKTSGEVKAPIAVCYGPYIIDAYAQYYDCTLSSTTTFYAVCSDGYILGPLVLPAGSWRITVDCYPAYVVSFYFY